MERRGGVAGNKSPFKNYAGAQIRKENFMATKKTAKDLLRKLGSGKEGREKADSKTVQAWNNVKGLMRLWATERGNKKKSWLSFSTSIGKKNEDEKYDNVYFDVLFKKNEAPEVDEGAFEINVKKGFLTLTVYSDGSVHPAVMVMEYDLKDEGDEDDEDEDDDLPF